MSYAEETAYQGECFAPVPPTATLGEIWIEGKPTKAYRLAGDDLTVIVYKHRAVVVYYAPTCMTLSFDWRDRDDAWAWANERRQHLRMIGV